MPQGDIGYYWHNLKTGESEYLTEAPIARMEQFIPQHSAAQMLYRLHLREGKTTLEAARLVLEKVTQIHAQAGTRPRPDAES